MWSLSINMDAIGQAFDQQETYNGYDAAVVMDGKQGSISTYPIWKLVWSLAIPGKVKHFVWKCLKGVLPCLGILAGSHIPTSA